MSDGLRNSCRKREVLLTFQQELHQDEKLSSIRLPVVAFLHVHNAFHNRSFTSS